MSVVWNVGDLIAMPGLVDATLVSGDPGHEWSNTHVAIDDSELPLSDGSGLAILATALPRESWRVDAIVRRVRDKGYRVVVAREGAFSDPGTRRLANHLSISVLETSSPLALARSCWEIEAAQDSFLTRLVRSVTGVCASPFENVSEMLAQIARVTGFGVALVHKDSLVAQAGKSPAVDLLEVMTFTERVEVIRTPTDTIVGVRIDVQPIGEARLVMFTARGEQFPPSMLITLVEVAAPAVGSRMLMEEARALNDASTAGTLIQDFLEHKGVPNADVDRRMHERGWSTSGHHLGFRILPKARASVLPLMRVVHREFAARGIRVHLAPFGKGLSGWISSERAPLRTSLDERVATMKEVHTALRDNWDVSMGVGGLHSGWSGLALTLDEAADAARVAGNRSSSGYFLRMDELGIEQLLLAWTSTDSFVPAAAALLAPVREYDPGLIRTLTAFLDNESAVQATAVALGVHRNTVASHIHRIETLLGVSLDAPDVRLSLQLACRALNASTSWPNPNGGTPRSA